MGKRDMRKEIAEAVTASDRALQSLEEAGLYLSKAAGWGVWDLPGGGMFGTFMKHSRLDDASRAMEAAKSHLRRLKRELLDVELPSEFKLEAGDFLAFADYFFDGIIADWMVQTRIKDAEAQVEEAKQRVTRIRSRLYELRAETDRRKKGGKCIMGCLGNVLWFIFRRLYKRAELASDRLPVVYHDHRDSRGAAVLQICKPELFPLW